jgi:glutaredoxin-like protein
MLPNSEGRKVPEVAFRVRRDGGWDATSTEKVFKGRTVVAFALPGAYTPTCSSAHLPRYNELAPTFRKLGVDDVVCISVNDPFVMAEWQKDQHAPNVTFLPDGNGEFSRGMGMLVDKSDLNFGARSWRYSMLVKDGVIEKMFIEPEKDGDPYEVSDADTMLHYLAPKAQAPEPALVFAKRGCPFCARAKQLLRERGIVFEEVTLGEGITTSALRAVSGKSTAPQVFIGGRLVGGAEELEKYFAERERKAA